MPEASRGKEAEAIIARLCELAIFSDNIYPDTTYSRGKLQKELCDIALVHGKQLIAIQIKGFGKEHPGWPEQKVDRWARKKIADAARQHAGSLAAIRKGLVEQLSNDRNSISVQDIDREGIAFVTAVEHRPDDVCRHALAGDGNHHMMVFSFDELNEAFNELDTLWDLEVFLEAHRRSFDLLTREYGDAGPSNLDMLAQVQFSYDTFFAQLDSGRLPDSIVGSWERFCDHPDRALWNAVKARPDLVSIIADDLHRSREYVAGDENFDAINNETAPKAKQYLTIVTHLSRLPKMARYEITKKLIEKSAKYVPGGRPRYFSYQSGDAPTFLFLVFDGDRGVRCTYLLALSRALQVERDDGRGVIAIGINSAMVAPGESSTDCIVIEPDAVELDPIYADLKGLHGERFFADQVELSEDRYAWSKRQLFNE